MFKGCSSLLDIKRSNGNIFQLMFWGCSSLSNTNVLEKWNVYNSNNFRGIFWGCLSLLDIKVDNKESRITYIQNELKKNCLYKRY